MCSKYSIYIFLILLRVSTAIAPSHSMEIKAVFGHKSDTNIETETINLIDEISSGGQLYMAVYYLSDVKNHTGRLLSSALICARLRGVKIQILTEARWVLKHDPNSKKDERARQFIQKLTAKEILKNLDCPVYPSAKQNSVVKVSQIQVGLCNYGCAFGGMLGGYEQAIQHNKFLLIRDQQKRIVVQTSSNFSKSQQNSFQDMVIVKDNQQLFGAYKSRFDFMVQANDHHEPTSYSVDHGNVFDVYFFPRGRCQNRHGSIVERCLQTDITLDRSQDTIVELLQGIEANQSCKLHINMYLWSNSLRGRLILKQIIALVKGGCEIKILANTKHLNEKIARRIRQIPAIELTLVSNLHSKYVLFEGRSIEGKALKQVWAGSHNFTNGSLRRNDETILVVRDEKTHQAYLTDWQLIFNSVEKAKQNARILKKKRHNKTAHNTWFGVLKKLWRRE